MSQRWSDQIASETHGFSAQGLIWATFDQRKFRSNLIRTPSLSSKPSSFQPTSPKNHTTRGKQSSSPLANEVADTFAAAMSGWWLVMAEASPMTRGYSPRNKGLMYNCLVVWNMAFMTFHIFQRGRYTTNQILTIPIFTELGMMGTLENLEIRPRNGLMFRLSWLMGWLVKQGLPRLTVAHGRPWS